MLRATLEALQANLPTACLTEEEDQARAALLELLLTFEGPLALEVLAYSLPSLLGLIVPITSPPSRSSCILPLPKATTLNKERVTQSHIHRFDTTTHYRL